MGGDVLAQLNVGVVAGQDDAFTGGHGMYPVFPSWQMARLIAQVIQSSRGYRLNLVPEIASNALRRWDAYKGMFPPVTVKTW